jgi:hypothetical protein
LPLHIRKHLLDILQFFPAIIYQKDTLDLIHLIHGFGRPPFRRIPEHKGCLGCAPKIGFS